MRSFNYNHSNAIDNVMESIKELDSDLRAHPELLKAMATKKFATALSFCSRAYKHKKTDTEDYVSAIETLNKNRWKVAKNKRAKRTYRVEATLCIVSVRLTVLLFSRIVK
jgi:pantoate kinase